MGNFQTLTRRRGKRGADLSRWERLVRKRGQGLGKSIHGEGGLFLIDH